MAKKKEALARALGTLEYTLGFEIMNFLKDKDVNEIIVNPDTKDLLKKAAGEGPIFPMLVMTQPSFPSMKPVTPFRYRVGA